MGIGFADRLDCRNLVFIGNISSSTRIHNELVASTDNEENSVPQTAHIPQNFRNFCSEKYFKNISKKFPKTAQISRNYEKVLKNPPERKIASLIFDNNFEPHIHNGFLQDQSCEHPPSTQVDTAQ
jgi:hypothetical protein